jgi:hypothetical protein
MTDARTLVAGALQAAKVETRACHSWFGVTAPAVPPETVAAMTDQVARAYLVYGLQAQLYGDFYCAGGARPTMPAGGGAGLQVMTPFMQSLSEANAGTGTRESGWTVVAEEGDTLVVSRQDGGVRFWAQPSDVIATEEPRLGATIGLTMPKELLRLSPGFYMALGDAELPFDDSAPLIRFYWNLHSSGASPLVAALTREFNRSGLPFRFKVVSEPERFTRCDAGVLYLQRSDFAAAAPIVASLYDHVARFLEPNVPALTKELAPGLGLAEDPGALVSFGMSRCYLLAEAIVRASERGATDLDTQLAVADECFTEAGLDLDMPHLEAGSADIYSFAA